jgi:Tfp pilus assembly protein PilF
MPALCLLCVLTLVLALGACAAGGPKYPPGAAGRAEWLEDEVSGQVVRESPETALVELDEALRLYSLLDDQAGQVRMHLRRARLLMASGQPEAARPHLHAAREVANRLGDQGMGYEAQLLLARLDDDPVGYEAALSLAATPLQRAVALTYLGQVDQAHEALRRAPDATAEQADDYGFVLYRYARAHADPVTAEEALVRFKQAENFVGIADTLCLLGQIQRAAGEEMLAQGYFARALTVSRALGDAARVQVATDLRAGP